MFTSTANLTLSFLCIAVVQDGVQGCVGTNIKALAVQIAQLVLAHNRHVGCLHTCSSLQLLQDLLTPMESEIFQLLFQPLHLAPPVIHSDHRLRR